MKIMQQNLEIDDHLRTMADHDFAWRIKHDGWEHFKGEEGDYNVYNNWIAGDFDKLEKFTTSLYKFRGHAAVWTYSHRCSYHTHVDTPKCQLLYPKN